MPGICLAAGVLHAFIATTQFTLAWTHSIEKIRWEEDYAVVDGALRLTEARIRGSGAGMEPPVGARFEGGVWRYKPELPALPQLRLTRSVFAPDYELCTVGACRPLSQWIPISDAVTTLEPCVSP